MLLIGNRVKQNMAFILWPPVSPRWWGVKKTKLLEGSLKRASNRNSIHCKECGGRERERDLTSHIYFYFIGLYHNFPKNSERSRKRDQGRRNSDQRHLPSALVEAHSLWHVPPQRTMLLISRTIFPREQKLTGKAFPGDISLGKRQAHNREKRTYRLFWGLQRDTNSGFSRESQRLAGTFFRHVTHMCFTYPEVANFRGPLLLFPLPPVTSWA